MEYQKLIIEKQNRIGIVKINNPEALNALNTAILLELGQAFDELATDGEVDVIVLTGEGRAFVAGADIAERCVQSRRQRESLLDVWEQQFSAR